MKIVLLFFHILKGIIKFKNKQWVSCLVQVLLIVFVLFSQCQVLAAGRQQLNGHLPKGFEKATFVKDVPESDRLNLTIVLPMRNQKILDQYIRDLGDPKSPRFRHEMSREKYDEMFKPTENDYQAIIQFVKSRGLSVVNASPDRTALSVTGAVREIQKTFHVHLHYYRMKSVGEFRAPDVEPSIDLDVPILGIANLVNLGLARPGPNLKPMNAKPLAVPNVGSGSGGSFIGNDFRTAYNIPSGLNGVTYIPKTKPV